MKRITPSAECSCGPVKTSPEGMLRLPSELTHTRSETSSRRSVPSPRMWISRAGASRSISPAWNARSSPQAATGSSRSRNSARVDERLELPRAHPGLLGGRGRRPQRDRPALGQPQLAQRRLGPRRARQPRRVDRRPARWRCRWPGSAATRRARARRRARPTGTLSSCASRTALQKPSDCPGSVDVQQRPRAPLEHLALQRQQQRRRQRRGRDRHLLAFGAPRGSSRSATGRSRRRSLTGPPCRESARPGAARRTSRIQRRSSPRRSGSARAAPSGA